MEKILYSTSELLFSNRSFWLKTANAWVEEKSILDAMAVCKLKEENSNYNHFVNSKTLYDFISNTFWKFFSRRIWQKDDFNFEGVGAAVYIKSANRYKIKFNPFRFYELYISAILNDLWDETTVKNFLAKLGETLEKDEEITNEVQGINFKMLKILYKCQMKKEWDHASWQEWNFFILNDRTLLRDLLSVFIHEYLHIILNHISTRYDTQNARLWNFATDFAINQSCIFTDPMSKVLITVKNRKFYKSLTHSTVVYQYKNDKDFQGEIDKIYTIDQENVYSSLKNRISDITKRFQYENSFLVNSINGRSADEYYRILLEGPPPDENGGGYDDHASWGQSECDVEMEKQEEAESKPPEPKDANEESGVLKDVDEKGDQGEDSNDEANGESEELDTQNRSKKFSEGFEHQGFDALEDIAKRSEARNAFKDVLNSAGIDANDPEELLKGIESIPGLKSFGESITNLFKVKTKNWKQMLQNFLNFAVNVSDPDYTMSRESRTRPDYFPGKKLDRGLDCILAMDTSGSIRGVDWNDYCNQVTRIAKDFNAQQLRVIQCHTRVSFDGMVNISKINKMNVKETGGTMMQVIFERLKKEKNRKPVILFTDGDIDHFSPKLYNFKILMFLSRGHSHFKPNLERLGHHVICQDEE